MQQFDAAPLSEPLPRQLQVPLCSAPLQQLEPEPGIPFGMQQTPAIAFDVQQSDSGAPLPRLDPAGRHENESTPPSEEGGPLDDPVPEEASAPDALWELLPTSARVASRAPTRASAVDASTASTPATSTPHATRSTAPATGSTCVDRSPIKKAYRAFLLREGR